LRGLDGEMWIERVGWTEINGDMWMKKWIERVG
jgi:hypothetical protein